MRGECTMLRQDQNQGGKLRWRCTTDQMLRKTVLPVSAIALCALLLVGLSACGGSHDSSGNGLERPAGFTDKQWLGKQLFFDANLSDPAGLDCAACHASQVGWTGPDEVLNQGGAAYGGAVTGRFGNRKPPSSAYGGGSPVLHLDATNGWTGGMFWDGRATGLTLGDPLAEQAIGPFLNPLEQNNADAGVVVNKVKQSSYANLFKSVWGSDAFSDVNAAYNNIGRSIASYERSNEVSPYNSRYDTYVKSGSGLTSEELQGLGLFNGKAKCIQCHSGKDFTDFTYANLGVPKNPMNPFYSELASSTVGSGVGASWADQGLGGYLKTAGYDASVLSLIHI